MDRLASHSGFLFHCFDCALDYLVGEHASPTLTAIFLMHVYEVRPRTDQRGVDLISDVLPFGRLWYDASDNAIGYAMQSSRSHGGRNRQQIAIYF
jgi:hypothetical protein